MPVTPSLAIVLPVYNDEEWVSRTIESCLAQTLTSIEILCVDDASTDTTREIVEAFKARDSRIRLIGHHTNRSPYQARRTGLRAVRSPYVLFLDGDDELAPTAAEKSFSKAQDENADIVGFGVDVITSSGVNDDAFETRLQPEPEFLEGGEIVSGLFPIGKPVQMQVWRYLYRTELLASVYSELPDSLRLYRADDLPISFLAAVLSERYVSLPDRLYYYHFSRGGSGQRIDSYTKFDFYRLIADEGVAAV